MLDLVYQLHLTGFPFAEQSKFPVLPLSKSRVSLSTLALVCKNNLLSFQGLGVPLSKFLCAKVYFGPAFIIDCCDYILLARASQNIEKYNSLLINNHNSQIS